jgi:uncharacterized Zn finger protein (UPF0148 family)
MRVPKPLTQRGVDNHYGDMKITDIHCPTCGATAYQLCLYDFEAFCLECGEVFQITTKTE